MAIISGIGAGLVTGITLLLALVFVEYAKLREKSEKAFVWIGAGAVSFILGGVFKALEDTVWAEAGIEETIGLYGLYLFQVIGLILVLIGALWAIVDLVTQNM